MFGAGVFLIGLSYLDCTQTALAVVLLVLAVTMSGLVSCGYYVNHMDIAPQYAGILMGLSNGISALTGFAPPYVAFVVTQSVSKLDFFSISLMAVISEGLLHHCGMLFIKCGMFIFDFSVRKKRNRFE